MTLQLDGSFIGPYRVIRHLKNGSFSRIYLARGYGGEDVIVKALNPPQAAGGDVPYGQILSHFENEIAVMQEVSHANVVRLRDHGRERDRNGVEFRYIVCEYMPGGSLAAHVRRGGPLGVAAVVRLFGPLREALREIHARDIVHCDIKPSNLLLDDAERPEVVKIADFGVAHRLVNGVAVHRTAAGTPPYAAPEHHPEARPEELQQVLDGRADIYSLAMTISFALTGVEPRDRTRLEHLPPAAGPLHNERALAAVLARATAQRVEQRYATVDEFWEQLERLIDPSRQGAATTEYETETVVRPAPGGAARARFTGHVAQPEQTFRLPYDVPLEIVSVPGGPFLMGSSEHELAQILSAYPAYLAPYIEECLRWELGRNEVVIVSPFRIGKYPVTNRQWRVVAAELPKVMQTLDARKPNDDHPVTDVTWEEALEFCERLKEFIEGAPQFRLPSEAEWEYACRARTSTAFHFGDAVTPRLVNYNGVIPGGPEALERGWKPSPRTHAVGGLGPVNGYGLYDMHGNVWEWCADSWHESYDRAPANSRAWEDAAEPLRVIRGGSHQTFATFCRSASRGRFLCNDHAEDIGFRVAI